MQTKIVVKVDAVCEFFEIHRFIEERHALRLLKNIRKNFEAAKVHFDKKNARLSVVTGVVNPQLIPASMLKGTRRINPKLSKVA